MKNPLARLIFIAAVPFAFALGACAPMFPSRTRDAVSTVPGPNGKDALLISCEGDTSQCARMAARLCPAGYALHGMGQATPRTPWGGRYAARAVPGFMFVTCNDDPSVVRAARARARCSDAYSGTESFAAYWSARRNRSAPHDRRAHYPSADEFETACIELPARTQRCMQTRYRGENGETCDAALGALAASDAHKIDALFFE
jgi:hypothetical protein